MGVSKRGVTLHLDADTAEVESADIAFGASGTHRQQVEELLRRHPAGLTMHQCAELLGWNSRDNVNPRMQELKEMGLAYQPGERRATGLGGVAAVWRHTSFVQPAAPTTVTVKSTGRTVTRTSRGVPKPQHLAPPAKDLKGHEPKIRPRRGAQSKRTAEPLPPRRVLTEEEKAAKVEALRQRDEERVRAASGRRG
jgi:hypothetical protein